MFYNILMKFISVNTICSFIAHAIGNILEKASRKGGEQWDKAKAVIKQIHGWCELFLEVYDDDIMSEEEEQKVADAIKSRTNIEKVVDILKK